MNKQVAVMLPIYQKKFTEDEIRSLSQLRKKLYKRYEIFIITHKKLLRYIKREPLLQGYKIRLFQEKYFKGYAGHNKLLRLKEFYLTFKDFEYMLSHQTDCLVFGTNLSDICKKGYDYIGAPVFYDPTRGDVDGCFVGNGGFSLKKISTALKVLENTRSPIKKLRWATPYLLKFPRKIFNRLVLKSHHPIASLVSRNDDVFWSCEAKKFYPDFRIASIEDACKFSFENSPERCLKMNKGELPFGCHAYPNHKDFWRKYSGIEM